MKLVFAAIFILIAIIEPFKGFNGEYYIRGKAYINKLELKRKLNLLQIVTILNIYFLSLWEDAIT